MAKTSINYPVLKGRTDDHLALVKWLEQMYRKKDYSLMHEVRMVNYTNAVNPTYADLLKLLEACPYDRWRNIPGKRVCRHYAVKLHNYAERRGVRCGYVTINYTRRSGHAVNVFETTDKGTVYVDICCPGNSTNKEQRNVKFVDIAVGSKLNPRSAFSDNCYENTPKVKWFAVAW